MTKHTGKFVNFVIVTGCSAFVLSSMSLPAALCDELRNAEQPEKAAPIKSSTAESASTPPATLTQSETTSAKPATPTQPETTSAKPATPTPPETTSAKPATPTPLETNSTRISPETAPRSATLDRHKTFVQFIEAVTDKAVPQEIQDLLQGVVSLERKGNDIELTREDGSKVMAGGETHFGATVIGDFSEARDKVAVKFGPEVGALIDEFVGVKASGSHMEVIRTGPEIEDIDLSEKKINRQLPLRRVRLSKISLDVDVADAHPVLRNITGIEAVPNTALEIPIVLKEFSRAKNSDGDDVFTFGVKNPIPFVKPFKKLLGIKEIIPLTWTVKRSDVSNKEIGVKVPVEQLGEKIGAETFKQLGAQTGGAPGGAHSDPVGAKAGGAPGGADSDPVGATAGGATDGAHSDPSGGRSGSAPGGVNSDP